MKPRTWRRAIVAAGAVLFLAAATAEAQGIVDQENLAAGLGASVSCGVGPGSISQGFTPALSPLIAVELFSYLAGISGTVRIRAGAADGPVLGETTAPVANGWTRFDFPGSGIATVPGQLYVIEWVLPIAWGMNLTDTYAGGNAFGCTNNPILDRDMVFRTYVQVPTPVGRATWGKVKTIYR
jgi:hypothetical protein